MQWNCRSRVNIPYLIEENVNLKCDVLAIQSLGGKLRDAPELEGYWYPPVVNASALKGGNPVRTAIYISRRLHYTRITPLFADSETVKSCCIELQGRGRGLRIVNIYYPGGVSGKEDLGWLSGLDRGVDWLITGDFNEEHSMWAENTKALSHTKAKRLADGILGSDLVPLNDGSVTRIPDRNDQRSTAIDLTLASPAMAPICRWSLLDRTLGSDHLPILVDIQSTVEEADTGAGLGGGYNLKKADWGTFRAILQESTLDVAGLVGETADKDMDQETLDKIYETIREEILKAADVAIPKTGGKGKAKFRGNPWWSAECKAAVNEKNAALKAWSRSRRIGAAVDVTEADHSNYKRSKCNCNMVVALAKRDYFRGVVNTKVSGPKDVGVLWEEVRAMKGVFSQPDAHIVHNGKTLKTQAAKAEAFADTFATASSLSGLTTEERERREKAEKTERADPDPDSNNHNPINADISLPEIEATLRGIKSIKVATGADPISYGMLREIPPGFGKQIVFFYNTCWRTGFIPSQWRSAVVIPIPKAGKPKSKLGNYRPISLTPHLGKLFERILKPRLEHLCDARGVIPLAQAGFRRGRGVTDHTVRLSAHVKKAISHRHAVLGSFFDIKKAYDTVWHHRLLTKLAGIGIGGRFLAFVGAFLGGRSLRVRCKGAHSGPRNLDMGVPQGSVIAPLLFSIMLHDITRVETDGAIISLYADDIALWKTYGAKIMRDNTNRTKWMERFQETVDRLSHFMTESGFCFSAEKTVLVIFGRKNIGKSRGELSITVGGSKICPSQTVKFLGVVFDQGLTWAAHVAHVTEKARKKFPILRVLAAHPWANSGRTLISVAQALVRSVLLFGQEAYFSAKPHLLMKLQSVDAMALKIALGVPRTANTLKTYREGGVLPFFYQVRLGSAKYTARAGAVPNSIGPELTEASQPTRVGDQCFESIRDFVFPICGGLDPPGSHVVQYGGCPFPAWLREKPEIVYNYCRSNKTDAPHLVAAMARELVGTRYQFHLGVYTDGSVQGGGRVGAAFVVPDLKVSRKYSLPVGTSIFTAEMGAILMALSFFANLRSLPTRVALFSDSKSALMALESGRGKQRAEMQAEVQMLAHQLIERGVDLSLVWVPSHTSLRGNDMADTSAKEAARGEGATKLRTGLSAGEVGTIMTGEVWKAWREEAAVLAKEQEWPDPELPVRGLCVPIHGHLKKLVHRLRVGAWRARFVNPTLECACGSPLGIKHIIEECPLFRTDFEGITTSLKTLDKSLTIQNALAPQPGFGWSLVCQTAGIFSTVGLGGHF